MIWLDELRASFVSHGHIWLVSLVLVVAAVIDGVQLKVPNWLTFPFIITGWIFSACWYHWMGDAWWMGFGWSLVGTLVGLALLLPAYAIGGMGAGDVKLLMGVGAWVHGTITLYAFCVSAVVGAILALIMVVIRRDWARHYGQFWAILGEILSVRDPSVLAERAAERKSQMLLLPYGIPIAIGTIMYFAWTGMLI